MIAVLFEVWPVPEYKQAYLDEAARMRKLVEQVNGFISVERFESLYEPGKILSLSIFENEDAVKAWRNIPAHREAQALGRQQYFADYRLRIAQVQRDYGMKERLQAPGDSKDIHG